MDDCREVVATVLSAARTRASRVALAAVDTTALQPAVGTGVSGVPLAAADTAALQPAVLGSNPPMKYCWRGHYESWD
jgi:hypothetical protein